MLVIYLTTVFQPKHNDNILYFWERFVSYGVEKRQGERKTLRLTFEHQNKQNMESFLEA